MGYPMTLPTMAALSIAGAALGVHLGHSAIAQINPAYFAEPEPRFHADLAPNRSPDWAQVQVAEYQDAGLIEGLGTGCVGCRAYPEEYRPVADPAIDGREDGWAASAQYVAAAPVESPAEPAPDPEREAVMRYASYPVAAGGEKEEAPAPVEEPQPAEQ